MQARDGTNLGAAWWHHELPDLAGHLKGLLRQIPSGCVTTYGDLAAALGDRVASRWVGHYMLRHEHGARCPCHRVVRRDRSLGMYIEGASGDKARRLAREGVIVRDGRIAADTERFTAFRSERPLAELAELQNRLRRAVQLRSPRRLPNLVGGVDVSYVSGAEAVAAYALEDRRDQKLVWSVTARRPIRFPYISSYLAFRELPIILEVVELAREAGQLADAVLVDGSGILHPRRAGIASMLGVAAGIRTIGVTKKRLCGKIDERASLPGDGCAVHDDGRVWGAAIWPRTPSKHPLYVSPGHRASVGFSAGLVAALLADQKLPLPLYWADRISRQAARRQSEQVTVSK